MGFVFGSIWAECSLFLQGLEGNCLMAELIDKLMTFFPQKEKFHCNCTTQKQADTLKGLIEEII